MGIDIGHLYVRRSSLIAATPERVWQEFTSFDRLGAWFGRGHTLEVYEPSLGGRVGLSIEADGERQHFGGPIIVFDTARELSFDNNWEPPQSWPVSTCVTLRLTPLYDSTHVELYHHGFERLGSEAASTLEGYEAGWDLQHLRALKSIVEESAPS